MCPSFEFYYKVFQERWMVKNNAMTEQICHSFINPIELKIEPNSFT